MTCGLSAAILVVPAAAGGRCASAVRRRQLAMLPELLQRAGRGPAAGRLSSRMMQPHRPQVHATASTCSLTRACARLCSSRLNRPARQHLRLGRALPPGHQLQHGHWQMLLCIRVRWLLRAERGLRQVMVRVAAVGGCCFRRVCAQLVRTASARLAAGPAWTAMNTIPRTCAYLVMDCSAVHVPHQVRSHASRGGPTPLPYKQATPPLLCFALFDLQGTVSRQMGASCKA